MALKTIVGENPRQIWSEDCERVVSEGNSGPHLIVVVLKQFGTYSKIKEDGKKVPYVPKGPDRLQRQEFPALASLYLMPKGKWFPGFCIPTHNTPSNQERAEIILLRKYLLHFQAKKKNKKRNKLVEIQRPLYSSKVSGKLKSDVLQTWAVSADLIKYTTRLS